MRSRLVVLISHPIQYYAPLYRELSRRAGVDIHVVFLSDAGASAYHDAGFNRMVSWDIPLLDGYGYTVLRPGLSLDGLGFVSLTSPALTRTLASLRPDAILLYGYASRMNWQAAHWARRHACRVLYTSDSNANTPKRPWKAWLKQVVVRRFFRQVDAFLCTSEANGDYVARFGAPADRVWRMPFAIDVARYSTAAPPPGVERPFHFAWAGKLVPNKRPDDFIRAVRLVAEASGKEVRAILVGDGPMRDEVAAMVKELPGRCKVELKGFVNQAAMPATLQEAEVFVFTSMVEAYGLAATEAAAAGLALIVAEGIGCVGDSVLAQPGVNSIIYPPGDVPALARAMLALRNDDARRLNMQQASREIARGHDFPAAATVIENAVRHVCGNAAPEAER